MVTRKIEYEGQEVSQSSKISNDVSNFSLDDDSWMSEKNDGGPSDCGLPSICCEQVDHSK